MSIAIARGWHAAAPRPTYAAMAILPPMVGPRAALNDLKAFMRQRSREQMIGAAVAVLVTMIIVIVFFVVRFLIGLFVAGLFVVSLHLGRRVLGLLGLLLGGVDSGNLGRIGLEDFGGLGVRLLLI